jgi:hypothetical protein
VIARGIRDPHAIVVRPQRHLRTENGAESEGACGLRKTHHTVESVVITERETRESETCRFDDEFLGFAGAV